LSVSFSFRESQRHLRMDRNRFKASNDLSFTNSAGFGKIDEMSESMFERLGEVKLREIVDAFIDRVFEDRMIGFFFRKADKNRIKAMEFQLAAEFLGGDTRYQGRPLQEVHAKHPIMGGQFSRRLQILRETLERFDVPTDIREAWLGHTESLRQLITRDAGSDCDPHLARKKMNAN